MPSHILSIAQFLYGDPLIRDGFWYSHFARELRDLSEEQLYWAPRGCLCSLWHAGHIAHREAVHFAQIIQGLPNPIPAEYEAFGTDWCSPSALRASVPSVQAAMDWACGVRTETRRYLATLSEADLALPAKGDEDGLTVGHWVFITAAHTALHIGKLQMLRAMLLGAKDGPC